MKAKNAKKKWQKNLLPFIVSRYKSVPLCFAEDKTTIFYRKLVNTLAFFKECRRAAEKKKLTKKEQKMRRSVDVLGDGVFCL